MSSYVGSLFVGVEPETLKQLNAALSKIAASLRTSRGNPDEALRLWTQQMRAEYPHLSRDEVERAGRCLLPEAAATSR